MPVLPPELQRILRESFYIRVTMKRRRSGTPRTVELTYVWNGGDKVVLSGYPGKRDWVANMAADPEVSVHTVEFEPSYDIPARARVVRDRVERLPHLVAYIEHWSARPGYNRPLVMCVIKAVKVNRMLRLPMWGPFWLLQRNIFDHMPCVEVTFTGDPVLRTSGGPPPLSEKREGRP
jgi:deazaflavin-dependent oxidoreductase (nitroreductase family)